MLLYFQESIQSTHRLRYIGAEITSSLLLLSQTAHNMATHGTGRRGRAQVWSKLGPSGKQNKMFCKPIDRIRKASVVSADILHWQFCSYTLFHVSVRLAWRSLNAWGSLLPIWVLPWLLKLCFPGHYLIMVVLSFILCFFLMNSGSCHLFFFLLFVMTSNYL